MIGGGKLFCYIVANTNFVWSLKISSLWLPLEWRRHYWSL